MASYTDQDGKEQTIKKDIKYEVMSLTAFEKWRAETTTLLMIKHILVYNDYARLQGSFLSQLHLHKHQPILQPLRQFIIRLTVHKANTLIEPLRFDLPVTRIQFHLVKT